MKLTVVVGIGLALLGSGCATADSKKLSSLNTADLAAQAKDMAQGYLQNNTKAKGWVDTFLGFFGGGSEKAEVAKGYSVTVSTNETYAVNTGPTNAAGRIALENLAVISDTRTVVTTFPYRPAAGAPVAGPVPPVSIVLPPQGGPVVNPPSTNTPPGGASDVFTPVTNTNLPPLNLGDLLKTKAEGGK